MTDASCAQSTVLVVEDDPDIRESLRDALEEEGYIVASANNGREGLERLSEMGRPCLVLLDLLMPVMDGTEFLNEVRTRSALANIPVVVVSAWADEARGLDGATQGFLKKPVSLTDLLDTVKRFCTPASPGAQP